MNAALCQRIQDFTIAGTTTDITTECTAHLFFIGLRTLVQQFRACHKHTRDTKAALHCCTINEGLLQWMESFGCCQTFDSCYFPMMRLHGRYQAGHNGFPVEPGGTCSTLAFCTAFFTPCQSSVFPQ